MRIFQLLTPNLISFNLWFSILLIAIFVVVLFIPILYDHISSWLSYKLAERRFNLVNKRALMGIERKRDDSPIDELISSAGYAYNFQDDIFFSTMYAWQRGMGYCRLYDEGSAPLGMYIDCEPIHFTYNGKRWLIEFWKGQYGMTTGAELGIYNTRWPDLNIPGVFDGTFYNCASNKERMYMGFILYKNDEELLKRKANHWWLTGFKLGEYAWPSELRMDVYFRFRSRTMREAFLGGLRKAGYKEGEYEVDGSVVYINFDKPHTKQPYSRNTLTAKLMMDSNKRWCDAYQVATKGYTNIEDKLTAVKEGSPELYSELFKIGKISPLYNVFGKFAEFLNVTPADPQIPK